MLVQRKRNIKTIVLGAGLFAVLAIGAFFMANVEMPPWAGYASGISLVLFALPSYAVARRWLGWSDSILLIAGLSILALAIETSAILTGFPYGHFGYSDLLGFRMFGLVPWTVAFAWPPLILGAYGVAAWLTTSSTLRIAATAVFVTSIDLVIDPGAVYLGFWQYSEPGFYYGVPLTNFAGWLLSGAVGGAFVEAFVRWKRPLLPVPVRLIESVLLILHFWMFLNLFAGQIGAGVVGGLLSCGADIALMRYMYLFEDMIVFSDEFGKPIATGYKLPSHHADTMLHLAFSVFLFDRSGRLLMQQRAMSKKTWPGVWSNSCCGHPMLHETPIAAAKRRVKFELGIKPKELRMILPDFRYRAELDGIVENEICPVMVGIVDSEPQPEPSEVMAIRWVDWDEFLQEVERPDSGISPWAVLEAAELRDSEEFRAFLATFRPD